MFALSGGSDRDQGGLRRRGGCPRPAEVPRLRLQGRGGGGEGQRQAEVRPQEEPGDGRVADQGQPGSHHQGAVFVEDYFITN